MSNYKFLSVCKTKYEPWFESDRWRAEDIGLMPDPTHSCYYINFSSIKQQWFKTAIKQFIVFQATTKSYASCRSYATNLSHFSRFIDDKYPELLPNEINRKIIVDYLVYLNNCGLSISTRHVAIGYFKIFHSIMVQEKWLPLTLEPLIYNSDFPRAAEAVPKFIPESVIDQLKKNLHHLPPHLKHFIFLLLETGRRISEICTLPYGCLEKDDEEDVYLRVHDRKTKKHYLIPLSPECVKVIKNQQELAKVIVEKKSKKSNFASLEFLFPSVSPLNNEWSHMKARQIHYVLNQLAQEHHIVDENGLVWHFHAHQFRHTLGTRMINSGVPQAMVQRYLGHASPEMTARYAHIHHDTLKKSFQQFQTTMVDVEGKPRPISLDQQDAFLLKQHIMNQALPNGLCGLPLLQQRCPHANACLTCTHFRTHKGFLPQHEEQLKETNRILDVAKSQGWQRQVEMNNNVKKNLEIIIERLKTETENE
jgi:integrase/recombinase XerD